MSPGFSVRPKEGDNGGDQDRDSRNLHELHDGQPVAVREISDDYKSRKYGRDYSGDRSP
jgi:hypothetical protein